MLLTLEKIEEIEMSQPGSPANICSEDMTDKFWKALRAVPEFDGNPHVLIRFLNICDQIILSYINPVIGNELNNAVVINGILNKITGRAATTLAANGIPKDWNGVRNALINSFSDHRDESALYTDLSSLSQGSDTPHVFYERVQALLSTIMTYVELHESIPTTIEAKRDLYKKLALQTYTRGLHEPLGSRIRCMRPDTLEKALEFAQDELNVLYLQNKNVQPINPKRMPQYSKPFNFTLSNVPQMIPQPQQIPRQFSSQLPIYQSRPGFNPISPNGINHMLNINRNNSFPRPNALNQLPNYAPQGQGPSRTQQMMRALPRSNMSTGFRIPPRLYPQQQAQHNFPTPMSGISHPVARTLPLTHQINANELYEPYYYESEQIPEVNCDYDYDYYDQYLDMTSENETPVSEKKIENITPDMSRNFHNGPHVTSPE